MDTEGLQFRRGRRLRGEERVVEKGPVDTEILGTRIESIDAVLIEDLQGAVGAGQAENTRDCIDWLWILVPQYTGN